MMANESTGLRAEGTQRQRTYSTPTTPIFSKVVYNRRWFMLFLSFLLNTANSAVWISVPTVQDALAQQYEVKESDIVFLTNLVYLLFVPGSIIGFYVMSRCGLVVSTNMGGAMISISCWLRVASSYLGLWYMEILASVTFAIGQPMVMNGVSVFNVNWMAEKERFFATMVYSTVPSSLGGAILGLIAGDQITDPDAVAGYFVWIASVTTGIELAYAIFMREKPPTPPVRKKSRGLSMVNERLSDSDMSISWMMRQRTFLILLYNVGVQIGLICSFMAVIPTYMAALNYTPGETNLLLSMFLFAGIASVVMVAPATDKLQERWLDAPKHMLILLSGLGLFGAFLLFANSTPNNFFPIAASLSIISIAITAGIPIALEEGAAINPRKSAFSASIMIATGNVLGFIAVFVIQSMYFNGTYVRSCYFFLTVLGLQFVANFFIERQVEWEDLDDSDYPTFDYGASDSIEEQRRGSTDGGPILSSLYN